MFATRGAPSKIRAYVTDADGAALPKDGAPEPTVSVVRDSDGAAVAAGDAAFEDDGILVCELPAQAELDLLTATWKVGGTTITTYEEIVGARLCPISAVTEGLTGSPAAALVRAARDIAERFLEDECGVAFRPRYRRAVLDGSGREKLLLPSPVVSAVRSATVDGEAIPLEDLKLYADAGVVWREARWPEGALNVTLVYEHGFTIPSPSAGRCAALLARHLVRERPSNLDERSTQIATDEATYTLLVPGLRGASTSLPEVNAFVQSWSFRGVG